MLYSWICLPLFSVMLIGLSGGKAEAGAGKWNFRISKQFMLCFFLAKLFIWQVMRKLTEAVGIYDNCFKIASSFILCTVFAVVIHELIEKPSKKLLGRFIK